MSTDKRVGIGYDAHPFAEGRRLVLGGVELPDHDGLAGHSDADVVTHAVIDSLLGAAGLGDIGEHFPDSDSSYKDADSIELLKGVLFSISQGGWRVVNVDLTVIAEQPKLGEVKGEIKRSLAGALGVFEDRVNVKATTNEGMGFVGRAEGIGAIAVAQLER